MVNLSAQQAELKPRQQLVDKPWGREVLWARTPSYAGKLLQVHAGKRLSLQYHDEQRESQCLLNGRAVVVIEMEWGKGYMIRPFQRHRLVAITDADMLEVSTPEMGTTFRLEDDYARPHETEHPRRLERAKDDAILSARSSSDDV